MAPKRFLPAANNPLMHPEHSPSFDELVERRRLGQTNLAVKAAQVGTSNATMPINLGKFDYAHLRAPLPKDLTGSGIFTPGSTPESYFLMRRSTDGFISATGLFKASYPWAEAAEEELERKYVKSQSHSSGDETAGNVWIEPTLALKLAEDYNILIWVRALLDPRPIPPGIHARSILPPPTFILNPVSLPPAPALSATPARARKQRSASPAKQGSPAKAKNASPRKRASKATPLAHANAASATLQTALNNAGTAVESPSAGRTSTGKVEVETKTETDGGVEATQTTVTVELPPSTAGAPSPQDTKEVLATAKKMVEEASNSEAKPSRSGKRKAESIDEEEKDGPSAPAQPAKKAKILEEELRKERVKTKALMGLTATLAIGAIIPYIL
ncbi:MAG: hypothetical protein M1838_003244 [Thelocarpon superellum]|nr:MAG: hypothetical protein M1838_003244 [Thelocarpon superellum]